MGGSQYLLEFQNPPSNTCTVRVMRDAGKEVSIPFSIRGHGVSLMAIHFLTSVQV